MSDLHTAQFNESALECISKIPEQKYELQAWIEALEYITGRVLEPKSIAEAKAMLKER